MTALRDSFTTAPLPHDPDKAASVVAGLDPGVGAGPMRALLEGAAGSSPYLARLIGRHRDWLGAVASETPEAILDALVADLGAAIAPETRCPALRDLSDILRRTKSRAALLIALCDLGGVWPLEAVTEHLTRLADASVETAARWLLAEELRAGRLPGMTDAALTAEDGAGAGYIVLAMGKMGARELNYSSDIDLIVLFDAARFDPGDADAARARYIHVTRNLVKLLSENTAAGYTFRTDLRLRPAPSTTQVCLSTEAALRYYESEGRTWERAAHIKARPLVDLPAGRAYLHALSPFVWRRHLDFAAIDDIHEMLRKIRAQKVRFTADGLPGHDLKLGPGGIREIEFFAQTRQLIMGGRDPVLRLPTTLGALDALAAAGWIDPEVRDALGDDYRALRTVEHRLQMIEDAQTHAVPTGQNARARLAALCGEADLGAFERRLTERLARVHRLCEEFFGARAAPPGKTEAPRTEAALAEAGFERPGDAAALIARWEQGDIAATRSDRARALFAGLEGAILTRLSGAASPDRALVRFDRFLTGLPSGVQVFSLFAANPQLLDLIVEICAAAPRLAAYLARHPQTLDTLLDQEFWQPLPDADMLRADLRLRLAGIDDYERVLDATRRWAREHWFRVGVHVLRGLADPGEAGRGFSAVAETYIAALLPAVIGDFAARHGAPPGGGLAVLALGKLGTREMTAGSDLDLITIFDARGAETSEGPKPLGTAVYYRRLTQALVAALTAPTAEGALYEVDMRLRPSGRSGPVAVSLEAFESYQMREAWVWEHMALTRARAVAGPDALLRRIGTIVRKALARREGAAGRDTVMTEAREMRARLVAANAAERGRPWALKHAAGGLMEIEFLSQVGMLATGLDGPRALDAILPALADAGWLDAGEARDLAEAAHLQQCLQHIERVALDSALDPETAGAELRGVLVRAAGVEDFATLERLLPECQARAARIVADRLPAPEPDPEPKPDPDADP